MRGGSPILLAETSVPRNNVIDYSLEIPGFLCTSQMDSLKFTAADLKGPCVETYKLGGCSPQRKTRQLYLLGKSSRSAHF